MPAHQLTLRHYVPADADDVRTLYLGSLKANPHGFVQDPDFHGDIAAMAERFQNQGGAFVVGQLPQSEGCTLVAMGGLKRQNESCAEVCKLHVSAFCQGRGFGRQMCRHLLAQAKFMGLKRVELHVTTTQAPAMGLYRSLGFIEDSREDWHGEFKGQPLFFNEANMHLDLTQA